MDGQFITNKEIVLSDVINSILPPSEEDIRNYLIENVSEDDFKEMKKRINRRDIPFKSFLLYNNFCIFADGIEIIQNRIHVICKQKKRDYKRLSKEQNNM